MTKEKIRVYQLARELNIETKDLLDLCKKAGIDAKNQLSNLEPEHRDKIEAMIKAASAKPAPTKTAAPKAAPVPEKIKHIPTLVKPKVREPEPAAAEPEPEPPQPEPVVEAVPEVAAVAPPEPEAPPVVKSEPKAAPTPMKPAPLAGSRMPNLSGRSSAPAPAPTPPTPAPPTPAPAAHAAAPPAPAKPPTPAAPPVGPAAQAPKPPEVRAPFESRPPGRPMAPMTPRGPSMSPPGRSLPRIPSLPTGRAPAAPPAAGSPPAPQSPPRDAGTPRPPSRPLPGMRPGFSAPKPIAPPSIKQFSQPVKPKENVLKPIARFTQAQLTSDKPIRAEDVLRPPVVVPDAANFTDEEEGGDDKSKKVKAIPGRDRRREARNERAEKRKAKGDTSVVIVGGKVDPFAAEETGSLRTIHRNKKLLKRSGPVKPIGPIVLILPITVRTLSEAMGIRSGELLFKLMSHGAKDNVNINSVIDPPLVELLALDYNKNVEIRKPPSAEEMLLAGYDEPDAEENLILRAPIVTIMGHVDHGKTSLLDKIRQSNVVDTEAGGITQVIRAWRVDHGGRPITFLDTPGHAAFTKMRARGANVTDIAVIVVAADDGVMPQTEEAIAHAKAAGVSLVVALNKTDLPAANVIKTRQQLYSLSVLPDDMGGDTPFVETSAATGKGIDELLDQISIVAELRELKANPNKAAKGTCLEAMISEGEGIRATLLVREGTLKKGDVILCGHAYGKVRQLYDDLGKAIDEAGPSVPVRLTGLDEIPNADDPFIVLDDLALASKIAEQRKLKVHEQSQNKRGPISTSMFSDKKVTELKIVLKADFRGSVEAIRKELEKLVHEEVRVRILHTGMGAITESDVDLALASPDDTLVIGFNVTADDNALKLAESKKITIHEYDIIYNLTNDVKAALEGKLKPKEEVIHLGRAVVRETFKISKTGTIAGCYVTQGNITRSAKIRVIRDGIIIYPPAERTAGLDSLKRFKEDVGEVREGFECGIKVAGYDDIKVGDVIEAFRVDQVQRTLD